MRMMASVGLTDAGASVDTARFVRGEGLTGRAIACGEPIASPDVREDPSFLNRDWARAEGLVSAIGVPFMRGGRAVGLLSIFTREP